MRNAAARVHKQRLVMVGNGMAGMRTLEYLLQFSPEFYDITVFGAEPFGNYNRVMLSPVLADEMSFEEIILHDPDWYRRHGVTLHAGKTITHIDRKRRKVMTKDGIEATYDRLLLATGSTPFMIPVPGIDLDGVMAYRDIFDVRNMVQAAKLYKRAVVIGGGLLGLEAANGLLRQGMDVTVIHHIENLMERQLDSTAAACLRAALERRGMKFLMAHQTAAIVPAGNRARVGAVRFGNGSEVPADLVVVAAGIRPNTELAKQAGLYCERGVVVDDTLQTYDPCIYAVGECAQHRGVAYGLVAPLYDQARVCAAHLAEQGHAAYKGSAVSTKLKVTGIDMFSAGDFNGDANPESGAEVLIYQDPGAGVYKKLVLKNDTLIGAVLYGDARDGAWYFDKLLARENIAAIRDDLVFGRSAVDGNAATPAENSRALKSDPVRIKPNELLQDTVDDAPAIQSMLLKASA